VEVRRTITRLVVAARAWRWGAALGRAVLGALGLVVLGAIGQSAFARNVLSAAPPATPDAGSPALVAATPVTIAAAAPIPAPTAASSTVASPVAPATSAEAAHGHATPEDPVYLNQATAADLHRLPGVGPKRAEAIIALRTRLGHFRQIEDLLKVKGVGRSSLRKLRPLVRLDPPPTVTVTADAAAPDAL